jgi:hypothetical protein
MDIDDSVLKSFYGFARTFGYTGSQYAIKLNYMIRSWLAQEHICTQLKIDARPPHEVVSLIADIESKIRSKWQAKARATREHKKAKAANPLPISDTRQYSLI